MHDYPVIHVHRPLIEDLDEHAVAEWLTRLMNPMHHSDPFPEPRNFDWPRTFPGPDLYVEAMLAYLG